MNLSGRAVVALATSLVLVAVHGIVGMAIVAILVAAANAAGRAALPIEAATPDLAARRVDAAEAGVLLVNPRSGRGREDLNLDAEALRLGVRLVRLRAGESLAVLAERAVGEGADVLGVAGGDGSQGAPTARPICCSSRTIRTPSSRRPAHRPSAPRQGVLGIIALRADPRDPGKEWRAHRFVVDSSRPVPVGLDGEAVVLQPPLEFRILPGALRVRLPVAAPGASARPPGPGPFRTAAALLHVAAGRPHALR